MAKKYCMNCACYFINSNWEKCCVEEVVGADGKKRIKLRERLGMMGDKRRGCENWKPSEGYLRFEEAHKKELAERRAARKAERLAAKAAEGK